MDVSIQWGRASEDDVAHDTKKGSIARTQEGINSKGNILDRQCFIQCQNTYFTQEFLTHFHRKAMALIGEGEGTCPF